MLHIELRRWADVLVVCPASADTMAKIVSGIADNLLLSVVRAWEFDKKPSILCPAMNTVMFEQKVTGITIKALIDDGFVIVDPVAKRLACNDKGIGALAPIDVIVSKIHELAALYIESKEFDYAQPVDDIVVTKRHLRSKETSSKSELFPTNNGKTSFWEITAVAMVAMAVGVAVGFVLSRKNFVSSSTTSFGF